MLKDEQNWAKYDTFLQKSMARDAHCVYTSWDLVYIEYLKGESTEGTVRHSASQVRGATEHASKRTCYFILPLNLINSYFRSAARVRSYVG